MEVLKCYKIVVFPEISIKMKKIKTFYKVKTVSSLKKIIRPHPTNNYINFFHLCCKRNFLMKIYRNI